MAIDSVKTYTKEIRNMADEEVMTESKSDKEWTKQVGGTRVEVTYEERPHSNTQINSQQRVCCFTRWLNQHIQVDADANRSKPFCSILDRSDIN
jgi:hypothetical protein